MGHAKSSSTNSKSRTRTLHQPLTSSARAESTSNPASPPLMSWIMDHGWMDLSRLGETRRRRVGDRRRDPVPAPGPIGAQSARRIDGSLRHEQRERRMAVWHRTPIGMNRLGTCNCNDDSTPRQVRGRAMSKLFQIDCTSQSPARRAWLASLLSRQSGRGQRVPRSP